MAYRPDPQRRAGGDGCGKVAAGIGGERVVGHPDGFRVKSARVAGNRTAACGSILAQVAAGAKDAQPGGYVTIRSRRCTVLRKPTSHTRSPFPGSTTAPCATSTPVDPLPANGSSIQNC